MKPHSLFSERIPSSCRILVTCLSYHRMVVLVNDREKPYPRISANIDKCSNCNYVFHFTKSFSIAEYKCKLFVAR